MINARIETTMLISLRCTLSSVLLLLSAGAAFGADEVSAISTSGSGTLVMCRSWLLFHSCRDYNNVALPGRIVVGDQLPLEFGSNPKGYTFPVGRIIHAGAGCVVTSDAAGDPNKGNKIEVSSCRVGAGPH